jgi:hypothetical protein
MKRRAMTLAAPTLAVGGLFSSEGGAMTMTRRGPGKVLAVGAVAALAVLMAPAPAAHAGGSGCWFGCSSSKNETSTFGAAALFNWCWPNNETGDSTTTKPTCSSDGGPQKSYLLRPNGGHTPYDEDWDTLQIDAGWCYKVRFEIDFGRDFTQVYDQRGKPDLWVKVADNAHAHIFAMDSRPRGNECDPHLP